MGVVFTNTRGGALAKHPRFEQCQKHLARDGVPEMRFTTCATHSRRSYRRAGGTPSDRDGDLGHSTLSMTMNTYSHVLRRQA
jgi:hypothetical protein